LIDDAKRIGKVNRDVSLRDVADLFDSQNGPAGAGKQVIARLFVSVRATVHAFSNLMIPISLRIIDVLYRRSSERAFSFFKYQ
jgi:hypothetical protein